MNYGRFALEAVRHFGVLWTVKRARHALELGTGWPSRKFLPRSWEQHPLCSFLSDSGQTARSECLESRRGSGSRFFFKPGQSADYQPDFVSWDKSDAFPVKLALSMRSGQWTYFQLQAIEAGFPPDWHRNMLNGHRIPAEQHWSRISDFDEGDIKGIWELNRFGFAYTLVRAYWRTGRPDYAESFWQLVEDWSRHNPPQLGPNWKCGQEIALRIMAWCFALYGFWDAPATTVKRVNLLRQIIAVCADRIERNFHYALSQQNNHGISEGVGLWTVGLLFPEFRKAERWRETGRKALERQARELIYDDGAFAQHSANYHRLMLHDFLWAIRLGELNDAPLSQELKERVGKAADLLYHIQDTESGGVPCYGHNDGALILPLNNCGYQDFRPVVQAARYAAYHVRTYPSGPWDEDLLWLFGPGALAARLDPPASKDLEAPQGGCYTVRREQDYVFIRCPRYHHRPAHADALAVDLWWRGQNIALDAGTYSYNAPVPWDRGLAGTHCHNTVTVDGRDQMEKVGRFLWLPWLKGIRRCYTRKGNLAYWEGDHDGYLRLHLGVRHRRGVVSLGHQHWLVLDRLESRRQHDYRLHWLLGDYPAQPSDDKGSLALQTPCGAYHLQMDALGAKVHYSIVRGHEQSTRGWHSPHYGERKPALSWAMELTANSCSLWSLFGPTACSIENSGNDLSISGFGWHANLLFGVSPREPLVRQLNWQGDAPELLNLSECMHC